MRGRKPKPPRLKVLHGQLPPSGKKAERGTTDADVPEPFDWMSQVAKEEWRRIAPQLAARGLLTLLDQRALAAYCECCANYIAAKKQIEAEGSTYRANGYIKKHPAVSIRDQAARDMAMFARELGLVPTARQRLGAEDGPNEDDPLAAFLKGRTPSA